QGAVAVEAHGLEGGQVQAGTHRGNPSRVGRCLTVAASTALLMRPSRPISLPPAPKYVGREVPTWGASEPGARLDELNALGERQLTGGVHRGGVLTHVPIPRA